MRCTGSRRRELPDSIRRTTDRRAHRRDGTRGRCRSVRRWCTRRCSSARTRCTPRRRAGSRRRSHRTKRPRAARCTRSSNTGSDPCTFLRPGCIARGCGSARRRPCRRCSRACSTGSPRCTLRRTRGNRRATARTLRSLRRRRCSTRCLPPSSPRRPAGIRLLGRRCPPSTGSSSSRHPRGTARATADIPRWPSRCRRRSRASSSRGRPRRGLPARHSPVPRRRRQPSRPPRRPLPRRRPQRRLPRRLRGHRRGSSSAPHIRRRGSRR